MGQPAAGHRVDRSGSGPADDRRPTARAGLDRLLVGWLEQWGARVVEAGGDLVIADVKAQYAAAVLLARTPNVTVLPRRRSGGAA